MAGPFEQYSPFFSNEDVRPFLDTRDGVSNGSEDAVQSYLNRSRANIDAVRAMQPPIGNVIDESRLQPFRSVLSPDMTPDEARKVPGAVYNPGIYGDMAQLFVTIPSGSDVLAVARPKNTRVMLIIVNNNAANLYFAFDQVANAGSCPIPAGGTAFFDAAVPQNDLHLFYGVGAVTVPIYYMNVDLPAATG